MGHSLYLAWRYLRHQWFKSAVLVASITLVLFLPAGLQILVDASAEHLSARAAATPLVVGAKGSELELVLSALYFDSRPPAPLRFAELQRVAASGLARAIPLYCRFSARGYRIVGTSLDYFDFRQLRLAAGRRFGMLGECVVGADVARALQLEPGDTVVSSPETMFDLAGVYPLKMRVVGLLAPTGEAEDRAILVDVKTTWIIEGIGHGHQDLAQPEQQGQVLRREGNVVTGNAAVLQATEITAENASSFHFHGDRDEFPLTAVIALPEHSKSETLLVGRYQSPDEPVQIVRPLEVIESLLDTVFTVRRYLLFAAGLVGVATLLSVLLIFLLSLKLREREIQTLVKIGAARRRVALILGTEVLLVLLLSTTLAALLTWGMSQFSQSAIRVLLL